MKQDKQAIALEAGLLSHPALRRFALYAARFLIGFCLSHARIIGDAAPLGVSWAAAAPAGAGGVLTLLGVLAGYLTLSGAGAAKYIAVAVLVYAAGVMFRSTPWGGRVSFMPAVTAAAGALIGLVFLLGDGPEPRTILFFLTDTLMMGGMAFFYRVAFTAGMGELRFKRGVSLLLLASTLFIALSGITVMEVLHPARIAAGVFVLYCAWQGGMGSGCASGLVTGIALDIGVGYPFFSMAYGFAGLLAGVFRRMGKLTAVVVYVLGCGIAALWAGTQPLRVSVLLETFVVSVTAMLLPFRAGAREVVAEDEPFQNHDADKRVQSYARRRLSGASSAFRALHETLTGAFDRDRHRNDNDIAMVYDRVAERVCRRCRMRGECWDQNNAGTWHALADASGRLLSRMRADSADFPPYFANRCIQLKKFVAVANEELEAMLQRRQYRSRLMENRRQVCRQYAEVSRILDDVAEEVSQELEFDKVAERRVERFMESVFPGVYAAVYRDSAGRRHVELTSPAPAGTLTGALSAL
ncbi:MAG: hypothetical protein FWG93_07725, partial [Oscillospiraceae bacterium]|nr:hypothetical protein [Oscillospiraceae bacterium]